MLELSYPGADLRAESYNGKSLHERVRGKFYTPEILAVQLAKSVVESIQKSTTKRKDIFIVDPFCGDGQLLCSFLKAASRLEHFSNIRWSIHLYDIDEEAVKEAKSRVLSAASLLGVSVSIETRVGDSFFYESPTKFDIVITNPPWELLKPDRRETSHMSASEAASYRDSLKKLSDRLEARFPDSKSRSAWGGWSTNLARCGWDLSIDMTANDGVVGIILPASLLGDQSSARLREKAFTACSVEEIAVYPAEARLFAKVDQPVVTLIMSPGKSISKKSNFVAYDASGNKASSQFIEIESYFEADRFYTLPVLLGPSGFKFMSKFHGFKPLEHFEGTEDNQLWLGRELDETRISEKIGAGSSHPFIKGKMIRRHEILAGPQDFVKTEFVKGMESIGKNRIVWRDVSRPTQERRMITAMIPPQWIAGNSLHVACYRDGNLQRTRAFYAIMSSLMVEFQVRFRSATNHMSLGVIRQAAVPEITARNEKLLSELVAKVLNEDAEDRSAHLLEIAAAKLYGFSRGEMISLLDCLPKVSDSSAELMTQQASWSKF
ncbi:Alw26I/Eco31I/Esp3I family type II restriction adenine-specific DNA-methyltransferase [Agrobacterium sp. InxBP2]|uniref:Alw26I/Eco31I/Esp3I family type II restriction adenine-specific DNA-methyltransferase n=1 Tax=Agrobacterium sp. InxBP2 TaxID=2870329 RepID=UPI00249DFACD|nr:Alw26I/Eco31I/Esp3I family type II restriction adenine-specific DNA-methyltransferase [Agrobacterium sp. InxBP2]MCW8283565.1 Alw26I/Eco31I/Esp3I family type II restriction adenine-specific DNA-methyltransferase [Agrobacterium sp. InxBP2]